MEYITVKEAAERWGLSLRQVQRLLAGDRIPSVKKHGKQWMIPGDAEKPGDLRREKKQRDHSLSADLAHVIATTTVLMPGDNPDAILEQVTEERLRLQYEGEIAYLRGNFQQAMDCYYKIEGDDAARLRFGPVAVAAAISMGDYNAYTEIEAFLKQYVKSGVNDAAAVAEVSLATAAVSVVAPNMVPAWLKEGDLSALSVHSRPYALYLRSKYLLCSHQYETALAVAQTALALCASEKGIISKDIYLRLMCAVACCLLEREDEARRYLLDAMRISLPHGFISPFAEHVTAFGGLMEQCLEQAYPQYYGAILDQWKRTFKNWIAFHNQFTKDNVTLMLTLREYHLAVLVTRRVPYVKIAKQYHISVGRLKNIMLEIYGKLFVSGRDELAKYIM